MANTGQGLTRGMRIDTHVAFWETVIIRARKRRGYSEKIFLEARQLTGSTIAEDTILLNLRPFLGTQCTFLYGDIINSA